jgi:hypothetical protein
MLGFFVNLKNEGVLLSGVGRGKECFFFFQGVLSWVREKEWYSLFVPFSFPFSLYGDSTSIFSQELFFKKLMSFFGGTKSSKISTQIFF